MERQVEIIQNLTDSYVKIVTKQCRSLVPKMIMFLLIDDTKNFINTDLFAHFHSTSDQVGIVLLLQSQVTRQTLACRCKLPRFSNLPIPLIPTTLCKVSFFSNVGAKKVLQPMLSIALKQCFIRSVCLQSDLMEESAEELAKRQDQLKLYDACHEALRIIRDVGMRVKETVPAPLNDARPTKKMNTR